MAEFGIQIMAESNNYVYEYKGYQIKPYAPSPSSYCVALAGQGGKIPVMLEGLFTSIGIAKGIIDAYLSEKEVKHGKTGR